MPGMYARLSSSANNATASDRTVATPSQVSRGPRGGLQTTGGMMNGQPVSQRVRVDSIRAMYWRQVVDLGGPGPATADDFENIVRREQVDVRLVLTPEQRDIYDRHVAENRKCKPEDDDR
jgi:hypothetical protein